MDYIQEDRNLIFLIEGKKYTMVNMGEYIGNRQRNWYDESSENWRLMFCEDENTRTRIEALVDDLGYYTRFTVINSNGEKRVININLGRVVEDIIMKPNNDDPMYGLLDGTIYKAHYDLNNGYGNSKNEFVTDYLAKQNHFVSENDEEYIGELTDPNRIFDFIDKNKFFINEIRNTKNHGKK